jgi:DNA-directed RNA polymerase subunit RPC12/RpoP
MVKRVINQKKINNIIDKPKCLYGGNNQKLCNSECDICWNKSFASAGKSNLWSDKNNLSSREVFKSSTTKYVFDCDTCDHEFYVSPNNLSRQNCPYCSNRRLCSNKEFDRCTNNSFASSDKSNGWSENNFVTARNVFKASHFKYKFNCATCKHEYVISPSHIMNSPANGCSYCTHKSLCEDNNCESCQNNSFAASDKMIMWSDCNNINPRKIFKTSKKIFQFQCNMCKHSFKTIPEIINNASGSGCPYCENKKLCSDLLCSKCLDKSFLSCKKSLYWASENNVTPRDIFISSNDQYVFNCHLCGNKYKSTPSNILQGNWCSCTKHKTETKLYNWLTDNMIDTIHQGKFEWCKGLESNRRLPFDFVIESLKIIIELDGKQHFEKVSNWKNPEDTRKNDVYKMKKSNT